MLLLTQIPKFSKKNDPFWDSTLPDEGDETYSFSADNSIADQTVSYPIGDFSGLSYKKIDNITFIDVKQKDGHKKPINKMILIGGFVAILILVISIGIGLGVGLSTGS